MFAKGCVGMPGLNKRRKIIGFRSKTTEKVKFNLPDNEILYRLSDFYKVFGDSTRIRILYVLFESEVCVCDIADALNMTISAISHQLRILKNANLVKFRKEGKTSYYSLADDHVKTIIAQGLEHIKE